MFRRYRVRQVTSYPWSTVSSRGSKQPRSIASSFPSNWPEFVKITRYVVTSWWNNDSRNFTYSSAMQLEIDLSDSRQTLVLHFFQFSSFLAIRLRWIVCRRSFSVFYSCLFHLWSQFRNIAVYRCVVNDVVKRIIIWFILSILYSLFLISKLKFLAFSWIYFFLFLLHDYRIILRILRSLYHQIILSWSSPMCSN